MTLEEFRQLKRNDRVEIEALGKWYPARVCGVSKDNDEDSIDYGLVWRVSVVRDDPTVSGRKKPRTIYRHKIHKIRMHPVQLPAPAANVYADWLDEHGEPSAAAKLREAFPLSPLEEPK